MTIGTRATLASLAVGLLITAVLGAPVVAVRSSDPGDAGVPALAKPTQKPKPSHPHATPQPTATPLPTPAPTPKVTPRPNATPAAEATPRRTERPRKGDPTTKPTKGGRETNAPNGDATATPRDPADGLGAPGAGGGTTGSRGPSPELLGFAAFLAALVGIGTLWVLAGRRRKPSPALSPVAARVQSAPPPKQTWTNVRLDDNDALPQWLRLDAEPERAQLAHIPAIAAVPSVTPAAPDARESYRPAPHRPAPASLPPAREPRRFVEPLPDGAMRLTVGAGGTRLLDGPSEEAGVGLANLMAGDEVEVQDLDDAWVRVLTPLGTVGWIRAESLGFGPAPAQAVEATPAAEATTVAEAAAAGGSATAAEGPAKRRGLRLPRRSKSAEQPS